MSKLDPLMTLSTSDSYKSSVRACNSLSQPGILDRDHRLVGKGAEPNRSAARYTVRRAGG
jgi:hypothetical protein